MESMSRATKQLRNGAGLRSRLSLAILAAALAVPFVGVASPAFASGNAGARANAGAQAMDARLLRKSAVRLRLRLLPRQ